MLDEKLGNDPSSLFNGNHYPSYIYIYSKISMRVQQCVRFARYARSLSIINILIPWLNVVPAENV